MTLWVPWGTAVFCAQQGVASHSTHPYGVSCTDGVPIHHATHRAGSAVSPCRWGHAASAGRTVPGVSRQEGRVRRAQGLQPGWVPAVPARHTEARLRDISGGSRRVGGPDPRDAEGPPARVPRRVHVQPRAAPRPQPGPLSAAATSRLPCHLPAAASPGHPPTASPAAASPGGPAQPAPAPACSCPGRAEPGAAELRTVPVCSNTDAAPHTPTPRPPTRTPTA